MAASFDGDAGAFVQKLARGFEPDTAAPAGNKSTFPLQPVHGFSPLLADQPSPLFWIVESWKRVRAF
jgi:hypothetical protein